MRNQDSRKDTDKKVAYIADDGCKDTTDKVANDFVVAKTRQNRIIGILRLIIKRISGKFMILSFILNVLLFTLQMIQIRI